MLDARVSAHELVNRKANTQIRDLEDALFREWKGVEPLLVPDGVVDELQFARGAKRLLFVLKDVNDPEGREEWDLREVLRSGGDAATWSNIARWAMALLAPEESWPWDRVKEVDSRSRAEQLRRIAVMNVSKARGGGAADARSVTSNARRDVKMLARQFELYRPDLAVACGVEAVLIPQLAAGSWMQTSRGIHYVEYAPQRYGIGFYHPQAHFPAHFMFYALLDAVREMCR